MIPTLGTGTALLSVESPDGMERKALSSAALDHFRRFSRSEMGKLVIDSDSRKKKARSIKLV